MWNTPPRKTVNNNTLPTMPIGHASTLRCMPRMALAKPKPFPMISRQRMPGPISSWAFSNRSSSAEKSMGILHCSGRTNTGVWRDATVAGTPSSAYGQAALA